MPKGDDDGDGTVNAAHQKMNGDDEYQGMIAQAGADGLFVDGSVERMVLVKTP